MYKWEQIKTNVIVEEAFSGSFDKIRQAMLDIENTYKDIYEQIELRVEDEGDYDSHYTFFRLYGYRPETPEETIQREEREAKAREKRLKQLEKEKIAVEKRKKELEKQKKAVEKELVKLSKQ